MEAVLEAQGRPVKRQAPLCLCVRGREGGAGASIPMLALHLGLTEGYAKVVDLVMGWVFLVLKVRLNRVLFVSLQYRAISRPKKSLPRFKNL